jgi:hypothetical protein
MLLRNPFTPLAIRAMSNDRNGAQGRFAFTR